MLAPYKVKTRLMLWGGFLGVIVGNILAGIGFTSGNAKILLGVLGLLMMGGCYVLFIWGCALYAQAKGHHWAFGFFGLLGLIGILVLALMSDKYKDGIAPAVPGTPTPGTLPPPPYVTSEPIETTAVPVDQDKVSSESSRIP